MRSLPLYYIKHENKLNRTYFKQKNMCLTNEIKYEGKINWMNDYKLMKWILKTYSNFHSVFVFF